MKEKHLPETVCFQQTICTLRQTWSLDSDKWGWTKSAFLFSRTLILTFILLLSLGSFTESYGATITSTNTGGLWNATTTWVGAVVPQATDDVIIADGATVTINATGLVAKTLLVNGSLTYAASPASALTVGGSVTVSATGSFTSPSSGTIINHALNIGGSTATGVGGDLMVDGIFNMNAFATAGVVVTFYGTPNNTISGAGSTINFFALNVNKGSGNYNSILEVVNSTPITMPDATASFAQRLTSTTGTFKLSSPSILKPYYQNATPNSPPYGRLWLNNAAAVIQSVGAGTTTPSGGTLSLGGMLQIDAGTFSYGAGNSTVSCYGGFSVNGPNATLNVYGVLSSGTASTFTMTAGNINIFPQVGANSAPTTYFSQGGLFQFGGANLNFTGGTLTIFDPTLVVTSGMYYAPYTLYITAGVNNLAGSTIRLGDGISDLDGSPVGFTISSSTALGNVVINNNPASVKTTRFVKLLGNTTIAGNLTINSGTANQLMLNNFTLTMGGSISNAGNLVFDGTTGVGLTFNGSTQQTVGGTGTFGSGINNLTINNSSAANPSVDLQIPLTVSNSLTLTKGSLGSSAGAVLTLGKSATSTTFSMTRSGGSLALTPVFSFGGVTTNNVTYSAPSPAASITTGVELPAAMPVTTFTVNNASGVTLDKPVACTTLALTSGVLNVTSSNTITVTGSLATNITGGSATAYVNGPLTRTIPNNAVAANYKFPVGKTGFRLFEFATITTGGTGNATFTAEAFDAGPYAATAGTGLSAINTDKYWSLSAALGAVTITSSSVRITDTGMGTTNRMGQSNDALGTYNSIGGLGGATITSTNPIDYSAIAAGTYFRVGTVTAFAAGTYAIGPQASYEGYAGTYASMTNAVAAITATPIPGPVVFEFQNDYNPAIEPAMVSLTSSIAGSTSSPITFRPAANVSSVINFSRASTVITNAGADYITFDGRNGGTGTNKFLQFTNTTTTGAAITLSTDAQYNQILYCILKGSATTAATGLLTINAPSAGNNFLTVDNCNFDGSGLATNCIYATGTATDATITNNNFFDYRNGAGINLASGSNNAVIDNNSFYQTTVYNGLAGTTSGIIVTGGNNVRISNNNIGGNGPGLTGTWTVSATSPAAYNFTGISATSLATTSKIYNNKIQNFDWKSNVSTWTGMNVSGTVNVGTDGANFIGNNIDNGNIKVTYFSTGAPQLNGIVTGGAATIENNMIGSITTMLNAGITATGASFTGISSNGTGTIKNNTIGSKTVPLSINTAPQSTTGSAQNVYGFYSTGSTVVFTNNTLANINNGSTVASGITRGILLPNYASTVSVTGNSIGSISTSQPVTGSGFTAASLDGINIQAGNATSISISGNEIYNLVNNSVSAAVNVNGIYYNAGTIGTNKMIEKNYIHHFKTLSNTAILNGVNLNYSGAPVTVQNNIIQLGIDATGNAITSTAQINGIYRASAQACNFYFNTLVIEGSGVTAGAVNTYGLYIYSHSTEDIRDNLFINTRSGGGTNYAIRVTATGAPASNLTMNFNDYFVNGSGGMLGYYNGNIASLAAWKTATGLDANSLSIDPQFMSANNLVPTNYLLAAGTPISGINTDFGGTTRNATTPTMGAYEAVQSFPIPFAVTGSGAYCQGELGLPVGLANSEVGVTYTLFKDGSAQVPTVAGTGAVLSFGNQLAGTYTVSGTNASGTTSMTGSAVITENPILAASVTIAADANPVCEGTSVLFTATPVNGGTTPSYQWKNGVNDIAGETGSTYSYIPVDGEVISVVMTADPTLSCVTGSPATSNEVTMTVNPTLPASVTIAADANPVCEGTSVTYTATPFNGGTTPSYQWKNGANDIAGETGSTYSYIPVDGEVISVVMIADPTLSCVTGSPATSNEVTMTVNPALPASVTIAADANPVCEGTLVTFTATPANGGTTPSYQWKNGGTDIVGETGATYSYIPVNGDVISVVMTADPTLPCVTGSPATSNEVTITVNPTLPASVTIAAGANPVCEGTSVLFTATPVNGGTTPSYQWKNGGTDIVGETGATYSYIPVNGDVISVVMTADPTLLCVTGSPATSNEVTMTVNPTLPAGVTIAAVPSGAVCEGTSVLFTATPANGGTTPSYQWKNGANDIAGETSSTYSYIPVNGEVISVVMTADPTLACATGNPATSNTVTMTVNPSLPASVTIAAVPSGAVCEGTSVTFTATPANGGTTPSYQWKNGANDIAGETGSTYSYIPVNGEVISVVMTSSETCATSSPATSNTVTMTVNPSLPASVTIAADANPVCEGTLVTFTATPVNGGTPTYQWKNGANDITGETGSTYSYIPVNGEVISVVMTSSETCATGNPATSNTVTMTVNPALPAGVTIAADANPVCAGTSVVLTATPTNGGTTPTIRWYKNTVLVGTGFTYSYTPVNLDQVYAVMTSDPTATCVTGSPATSNTVTMTVNDLPIPVITNNTGTTELTCSLTSISLTASGGTAYAWNKGLGTTASVQITSAGNYQVTVTNANGCSASASIVITQAPPIQTVTASAGTITTIGGTTTLTVTATGGLPPYTYSLNGGAYQASNTFTVGAGTYTVTAKDANGCTMNSNTVTVTQPVLTTTALTYTGTQSVVYYSSATLSATLKDSRNRVVSGKTITFTIGSQSKTAVTDNKGLATTTLQINQVPKSYQVVATFAGDGVYLASTDNTHTLVVSKKTVTASLVGTVTKVYDGNAIAYLSPSNYSLSGTISGDVVSLNNPLTGTYNNNKVGTGKKVTVTGLALVGTNAGSYVLSSTTISANIGTITTAAVAALRAGVLTDAQTMPLPELKVYPNPFTEKLNIVFSSPTDTYATIEIFNLAGAKLESLFDGDVKANAVYNVEYIPRLVSSQVVIYRIILNGVVQQGRMIYQEHR